MNSTLIRRAPMTDAVTGVNALPGKTSDADMLRGMAGPCGRCYAAGRMTVPEVGALAGAGRGGKTTGRPRRAQRLPRARRAQAGGDGGVAPPEAAQGQLLSRSRAERAERATLIGTAKPDVPACMGFPAAHCTKPHPASPVKRWKLKVPACLSS
ncbi:MAG: hypothetical protein ING92_06115 [Rhodobacter sp.]|nr:hypothetical protein [Rhodobacter sp.]MCA4925740.1 hypothetical protein [Rhodobacter sp.]